MDEGTFTDLSPYEDATGAIQTAIDDADREVFLAMPAEVVGSVIDQLADAKSRGLMVILPLTGDRARRSSEPSKG